MREAPTILVIDDDPQILLMLEQMLTEEGYTVIPARNGSEGLELFYNNEIDLIITDIVMPEKDGMEMIAQLRRDQVKAKIIAISGGGNMFPEHYLDTAELFGAVRSFPKPIRRQKLLDAVKEVLAEDVE